MYCRHCNSKLETEFVDLKTSPPSNAFLNKEDLTQDEEYYPLRTLVCEKCYLVQIDFQKKCTEIFDENYAYFSSYSKSWLVHSKKYVEDMTKRFDLDKNSFIVEIASNDGYLLQYFKEKNIPNLGIEPTNSTAIIAREKGIETLEEFFCVNLAVKISSERSKADLILGNNVLAHVPDINNFVKGIKLLLSEEGVITMEFPHLLQLIKHYQFDTIYHEHYSYLSFTTANKIFNTFGLELFDVTELPTHGGSLRIFGKHKDDNTKEISNNVLNLLKREEEVGITSMDYYLGFQNKVIQIKKELLQFLRQLKKDGKKIAAYGAAAKGNTLLNFCGIKDKDNLIEFVVDASPYKQNKYLPGSHIPIVNEKMLKEYQPDYVLILPWNIKDEIIEQLHYIKGWGGRFAITIPELKVF